MHTKHPVQNYTQRVRRVIPHRHQKQYAYTTENSRLRRRWRTRRSAHHCPLERRLPRSAHAPPLSMSKRTLPRPERAHPRHKGPIPGLRGPILGLKGSIPGLRGPISGLRDHLSPDRAHPRPGRAPPWPDRAHLRSKKMHPRSNRAHHRPEWAFPRPERAHSRPGRAHPRPQRAPPRPKRAHPGRESPSQISRSSSEVSVGSPSIRHAGWRRALVVVWGRGQLIPLWRRSWPRRALYRSQHKLGSLKAPVSLFYRSWRALWVREGPSRFKGPFRPTKPRLGPSPSVSQRWSSLCPKRFSLGLRGISLDPRALSRF